MSKISTSEQKVLEMAVGSKKLAKSIVDKINIDIAPDDPANLALTNAHILVGNGSNVAADVAMSGDVTIGNTGVTAIGASKVTKTMLASGVQPSHMIIKAGSYTTVGGNATEDVTGLTGVTATDLVFVQLKQKGSTPRTVVTAVTATDKITVVYSGDPSNDHIIYYQVVRATS